MGGAVTRGRLLTMVAAAVLVFTGDAAGAPTWLQPVQIGPAVGSGLRAYGPHVALGRAGDAVVGWQAHDAYNIGSRTQVATRAAGTTTWSEPTTLAEGGGAPDVAVDPTGRAYAVFTKSSNVQVGEGSAKTGAW